MRRRASTPAPPPAPAAPAPAPYSVLEQVESHRGTLRVATLAKIFGVSRKTIYAMMDDGRIPTLQLGLEKKIVDPKSLAYVLRRKNPMMREAARQT